MQKPRPIYLNLWQIRLPLPGIVSILHRISGVLLFLLLPVAIYWLEGSLASAAQFAIYSKWLTQPLIKLGLLILLWGFFQHACAGIRFLLLDMHWGMTLNTARVTAKVVLVISLLLTLIMGVIIW